MLKQRGGEELDIRDLGLSCSKSVGGSRHVGISGTGTWTIDPILGVETQRGDKYKDAFYVTSFGYPLSPLRLSGTREKSGYDDPPNQKGDGKATIHGSTVLSDENTTAMIVTNGKSELEDYEDTFATGKPGTYRNVHENELQFDYQKV